MLTFVGDYAPYHKVKFDNKSFLVGNLECAFCDIKANSWKSYTSVLPCKNMDFIKEINFSALSLANNHTYDAGNFEEFYKKLETEYPNIQFFGTIEKPYVVIEEVAIIGCLEKNRSRGENIFPEESVLSLIKKIKSKFSKVYIYPHWGKEGEYTHYPSPRQQKLAHKWIDAGASGVFGSHSHVFQGKEIYKNKPVYYSLGNFYFPHPESKIYPNTNVGLTLEIENGIKEKFIEFNENKIEYIIGKEKDILIKISAPLKDWGYFSWAKYIGKIYLSKNTASWHIRLKNNFFKTLPLFFIWQIMPKTLLFRIASLFSVEDKKC